MRMLARVSWATQMRVWVVILLVIFAAPPVKAQGAKAEETHAAADPRAVVVVEHARFTVLTPQLIRMEWAADGKFEDHPSFVFLNRRLPVPQFTKRVEG